MTARENYIVYRDLFAALDMGLTHMDKVNYEFNPYTKQFTTFPPVGAHVEYVKDPLLVTFADLSSKQLLWTQKYAQALLNIREGVMGSQANVTFMPFTFNYDEMLKKGQEDKVRLEDEIKSMRFGLFAAMPT